MAFDFIDTQNVMHQPEIRIAGKCIYCGSSQDLTDEHIVPYALWGNLELRKASCRKCAAVTSAQELKVLRGFMRDYRTVNKSPTRHKKERPRSIRMKFGTAHREWEADVPAEQAIAFLALPLIQGPAILSNVNEPALRMAGFDRHTPNTKDLEAIIEKHNATTGSLECTVEPFSYCAMLVKIAFSYAAYLRIDFSAYEIFAPEIILNQSNDAWRYVGADYLGPKIITRGLHFLNVIQRSIFGETYLIGVVGLFSKFGSAPNEVVIGKARNKASQGVSFLDC